MKTSRIIVAAGAILIIALALILTGGKKDQKTSDNKTVVQTAPKDALQIEFAYSPEKEQLILPLIKKYNNQQQKVGNKTVFVTATNIASGEAQDKITRGKYKPTVWSPAGSLWGRLLNYQTDQKLVNDQNFSLVQTPLVIAIWEDQARALGWPNKKLGFKDIEKLATSPQGWGSVGKPEMGKFKLVHTNPDFSTSGLEATVAEYYAATGKKEGLKVSDINGKARKYVKNIENSIIHYGDTTLFIADQLVEKGKNYASAVMVEEVTLLDINKRLKKDKMVAIYPEEGTFISDSPFIILEASWVSPQQKEAAQSLQKFLEKEITTEVADRAGFRPSDFTKVGKSINKDNGLDPKQPQRVLGLPEPDVLAKIKEAWQEDRRPANVMLTLDVSGSMDDDRLTNAKQGLKEFLNNVAKQDQIGLTIFNQSPEIVAPIGTDRKHIQDIVQNLTADGGTSIFDTTRFVFNHLRDKKDTDNINAIVLLTDGEDTDSTISLEQTLRALRAQGDSNNHVRIFTIAYTSGAARSQDTLQAIAEATGGKFYQGNTDDIESVYKSISSFF